MKNPIILLVNQDPVVYQVDIEALTELLAGGHDNIGIELLSVIAEADEQFAKWICIGVERMSENDTLSTTIENFIFPYFGKLIMSCAMVCTKSFTICMEYNLEKSCKFGIEFNMSDPEAAKIEFSKRLDRVKGFRESVTFEEPVRISA